MKIPNQQKHKRAIETTLIVNSKTGTQSAPTSKPRIESKVTLIT